MIILFGKTNCGHTMRVIDALDTLRLSFEKKNIADEQVLAELLDLGGKRQVPFIVDGDVSMYESKDIIAYLFEKYGESELGVTVPKLTVHSTENENLCVSK